MKVEFSVSLSFALICPGQWESRWWRWESIRR